MNNGRALQVNLIYGDKVTFALGVGFVAGFATIVQFMAQLSDALVDENGIADGLGLFIFAMSLVAVLASVRCVANGCVPVEHTRFCDVLSSALSLPVSHG